MDTNKKLIFTRSKDKRNELLLELDYRYLDGKISLIDYAKGMKKILLNHLIVSREINRR